MCVVCIDLSVFGDKLEIPTEVPTFTPAPAAAAGVKKQSAGSDDDDLFGTERSVKEDNDDDSREVVHENEDKESSFDHLFGQDDNTASVANNKEVPQSAAKAGAKNTSSLANQTKAKANVAIKKKEEAPNILPLAPVAAKKIKSAKKKARFKVKPKLKGSGKKAKKK